MISRKLLITEYFGKLPFHYHQTFSKSDKINLTEGNKISLMLTFFEIIFLKTSIVVLERVYLKMLALNQCIRRK